MQVSSVNRKLVSAIRRGDGRSRVDIFFGAGDFGSMEAFTDQSYKSGFADPSDLPRHKHRRIVPAFVRGQRGGVFGLDINGGCVVEKVNIIVPQLLNC